MSTVFFISKQLINEIKSLQIPQNNFQKIYFFCYNESNFQKKGFFYDFKP